MPRSHETRLDGPMSLFARLRDLCTRWNPQTTRFAIAVSLVLILVLPALCRASEDGFDPYAKLRNIFDTERLKLTAEYSRVHYGIDSSELREPRMIVLHYTAFHSFEESFAFFLPSRLDAQFRKDISSGGAVNVSTHYLVDRDGTIYQLASENVICRHTIGFNYTAISIENVGSGSADLTPAQMESDAALVSRIKQRHPSIDYLIGHQEYRDARRPHLKLYLEKDTSYHFTPKQDPGKLFLERVRGILKGTYGITLKD
jgi:beta-N-acetylhexosaminidase